MAHDKTGKARKGRAFQAPDTIDLKATEIKAEPPAQPEPAAKPEPDSLTKEPWPQATQPGAESEPRNRRLAAARTKPMPRSRCNGPCRPNRPANLPWPLIAAGIAGAVLFLAIGIGAGHWLSRDLQPVALRPRSRAVPAELLDRLGKLETQAARRRSRRRLRNSQRSARRAPIRN